MLASHLQVRMSPSADVCTQHLQVSPIPGSYGGCLLQMELAMPQQVRQSFGVMYQN